MNCLDPIDCLSLVPVNPECPKELVFIVKWLKSMIKYKGVKLDADFSVLVDFFFKVVNSEFWVAINLFNQVSTKDSVEKELVKARDWIYYKEVI